MSNVQRYTESCGEGGGVVESSTGEYVSFADYAALKKRLAEAAKLLRSKSEHVKILADFTLQNCQGNGLAHAERAQQIAYSALKQQQVTNAFLNSPGCADGEKAE